MMEFGYYPGCALHGSSNDYERSVRAVLKTLDVSLKELDDWICCGASAAHCLNHTLSLALPARNLAIAEKSKCGDLLAPCPLCSMELIKCNQVVKEDAAMRAKLSDIVEDPVSGSTDVINMIQLFQKVGVEKIKGMVKKPLDTLKVACYYGCLLTRPPKVVQFDDCEHPSSMETLLQALGAETVSWNFATECCGGGMTLANTEIVCDLTHKILTNAAAHGANCVVVACPMCHVNLDMKQADVEAQARVQHDMMIYYLSDLVGMALGLSEKELGVDKHFVYKPVPKAAATANA